MTRNEIEALVSRLRDWKKVRTTPFPISFYLDDGALAADVITDLLERLRVEESFGDPNLDKCFQQDQLIKEKP